MPNLSIRSPFQKIHVRPEITALIPVSAQDQDLDAAIIRLQDALGVACGEAAGQFFADLDDPYSEWVEMSQDERIEKLQAYIQFEFDLLLHDCTCAQDTDAAVGRLQAVMGVAGGTDRFFSRLDAAQDWATMDQGKQLEMLQRYVAFERCEAEIIAPNQDVNNALQP